MATFTANYNLVKPTELTDLVDIDQINSNMDIIDTQLKDRADRLSAIETNIGNTLSGGTPHCIISQAAAANQNITDNTTTAVILGGLVEETISTMGDTANNRIVIPNSGLYLFWYFAGYASNATGRREIQLNINGSTSWDNITAGVQRVLAVGGLTTFLGMSYIHRFTAGDILTLDTIQTSGVTLSLDHCILGATWLRN